jgi:hypothetical protein
VNAPLPAQETHAYTLSDILAGLGAMAQDDPVLMMAQALTWLDPLELKDHYEYGDWYEEVVVAVDNTRFLGTDYHVDALQTMLHDPRRLISKLMTLYEEALPPEMREYNEWRDGANEDFFEGEVPMYIPLEPVGFYGPDDDCDDCDEDWQEREPTDNLFLEIIDAIGNDMGEPFTRKVARRLADDLRESGDDILINVAYLILWLYGVSNNTMLDVHREMFWEGGFEAPNWDEYDFIYGMQQQAFDGFDAAMKGKHALETDPVLLECLLNNARKLRKTMKRRKRDGNIKLEWTEYAGNRDDCRSRTQLDLDLVPFRRVHEKSEHGISG